MRSYFKIILSAAAFVFLFSSCSKKNEVGKMIPSDAIFVAHFDLQSLGKKMSWNDLKQTNIFRKIKEDSSGGAWKDKVLENPESTGIDFSDGLVFFVVKHPGEQYLAIEGKIKNEKDFEAFNKNFNASQPVKMQGDLHLFTPGDKMAVAWKENRFVAVANPQYHGRFGATSGLSQDENVNTDLPAVCAKLFSLKSDSSMASSERFSAMLKDKGDIELFQNTQALINSSPQMGPLSMLKLDAFLKDNMSVYNISFDDGTIAVKQKMYVSKELTDIIKKYMGSSLNMDMIKKIPSQNVVGILASNFKPEGITELIKLTGMDGMVNSYAQQFGFSLDDFSKATNGDWLLSFSDLHLQTDSGKVSPEGLNILFAAGVGDKPSLQKIIDALQKVNSSMPDTVVNYVMNNKMFVLSNHKDFATQYLNSATTNSYKFADKFSGHPVGVYVDLHQLINQFSELRSSSTSKEAVKDVALKTWDNIISSGGDYKDDGFNFSTDINFLDKQTNSLKQFVNFIDAVSKVAEEDNTNMSHKQNLDSLLVAPPVDTVK